MVKRVSTPDLQLFGLREEPSMGEIKSEYIRKYGDERRTRVNLSIGQTRTTSGTIVTERPSTIEVTQVWTKNERTWEDDYWKITHYHLDTIQETKPEEKPPKIPWWRRLFGLGPKLPEAKVMER